MRKTVAFHTHDCLLTYLPACRFGGHAKLGSVARGPDGALHGLCGQLEESAVGRHGGDGRRECEDWAGLARLGGGD